MNKREADRVLGNMAIRGYGRAEVAPLAKPGDGWVVTNPDVEQVFYSMVEWESWYYNRHEEYQVWRNKVGKLTTYVLVRNGLILDVYNDEGATHTDWIGQPNLVARKAQFRRRWDQKEIARVIERHKAREATAVTT